MLPIHEPQTAGWRFAALPCGILLTLGGSLLVGGEAAPGIAGPSARSAGEIKAMMQLLSSPADAAPQDRFLSHMRQYRYLCGVPYEDLAYDAHLGELAQAAAAIDARLNKLTHTPERPPGMSDAEYELGRAGAGQCNLFSGVTDPVHCVDGWMDDSDSGNIDRVGHRRWILNPTMGKSAFAASGRYAAMYAFDGSNKQVPEWDVVAYPARGMMPLQYFGARHAWSISLNPRSYELPAKEGLAVTIRSSSGKGASELALDYLGINGDGFGSGPAIIFRPKDLDLRHDSAFTVSVVGTKGKDGSPKPLSYTVHFMDLDAIQEGAEGSAVYTRAYQRRLDRILTVTDDVDQMEKLYDLLSDTYLAKADPQVRKGTIKRLSDLVKDQELKHEYLALEKYKHCAAMERKSATTRELVSVVMSYQEIAASYPKTRAGERALEDFNRLKSKLESSATDAHKL